MRGNSFDGKSWYPPPLSSLTVFDTRSFVKHRSVPLRCFSVLWDKTYSAENRDTCSFFPKNFPMPQIFRNIELHYEVFQYCDTKTFRQKIMISPTLSLIFNIFRCQKFSETQKDSPAKFLVTVRQVFDRKSWWSFRPFSPLLSLNFFATVKILKHKTEGFLDELFRYCGTKEFRKIVIPPKFSRILNFFEYPSFFWNSGGSTNVFSVLWSKTISTEERDTCPSLVLKIFWHQKVSQT